MNMRMVSVARIVCFTVGFEATHVIVIEYGNAPCFQLQRDNSHTFVISFFSRRECPSLGFTTCVLLWSCVSLCPYPVGVDSTVILSSSPVVIRSNERNCAWDMSFVRWSHLKVSLPWILTSCHFRCLGPRLRTRTLQVRYLLAGMAKLIQMVHIMREARMSFLLREMHLKACISVMYQLI